MHLEKVKLTVKRRTYYAQVESAKLTLNVVAFEFTEANDGLSYVKGYLGRDLHWGVLHSEETTQMSDDAVSIAARKLTPPMEKSA